MTEEVRPRNTQEDSFITACQRGSIEECRKLLQNGVNINFTDRNNCTPLFHCCSDDQIEVARFLINHGADVNMINIRGNSPLHIAAERGSKRIVLLFMLSGANPSTKNNEGNKAGDLNRSVAPLIYALAQDREPYSTFSDHQKKKLTQIFEDIEGEGGRVITLEKVIKFNRFMEGVSEDEARFDAFEFLRDVAICREGEVGLEEWIFSFAKLAAEQGAGVVDNFIADFEAKNKTVSKYSDFVPRDI